MQTVFLFMVVEGLSHLPRLLKTTKNKEIHQTITISKFQKCLFHRKHSVNHDTERIRNRAVPQGTIEKRILEFLHQNYY